MVYRIPMRQPPRRIGPMHAFANVAGEAAKGYFAKQQRDQVEAKNQQRRMAFAKALDSNTPPRQFLRDAVSSGVDPRMALAYAKALEVKPQETFSIVHNPYGKDGFGQQSSLTKRIHDWQGPTVAKPPTERARHSDTESWTDVWDATTGQYVEKPGSRRRRFQARQGQGAPTRYKREDATHEWLDEWNGKMWVEVPDSRHAKGEKGATPSQTSKNADITSARQRVKDILANARAHGLVVPGETVQEYINRSTKSKATSGMPNPSYNRELAAAHRMALDHQTAVDDAGFDSYSSYLKTPIDMAAPPPAGPDASRMPMRVPRPVAPNQAAVAPPAPVSAAPTVTPRVPQPAIPPRPATSEAAQLSGIPTGPGSLDEPMPAPANATMLAHGAAYLLRDGRTAVWDATAREFVVHE